MESSGIGYTEFDIRRVVPGDAEFVRVRIAAVLEEFHYRVLNDRPIQARRGQIKNVWAANTLELSSRLTIALKQISPHATLAIFDYSAQRICTKGDKQTYEREVDAIIALALSAAKASSCPACGLENQGSSRFCRGCGAPSSRDSLPAELEVMRLTAGARATQQENVAGLAIALVDLAITLPMILLGSPKAVNAGIVLLILGQLIAWFFLLFGARRLHRTLNPHGRGNEELPLRVPGSLEADNAQSLPPVSPLSVTEGTTELLGVPQRKPEKVLVERKPEQ
jgi:hypothetical protein